MSDVGRGGRCLVTGASGYIGGQLVEALLLRGWDVHVILRQDKPSPPSVSATTVHRYDGAIASLERAVEIAHPDIVFHLAAAVVVEHRADQIRDILEANVTFPTLLLDAMSRNGATRLVSTGTSWQHFEHDDSFDPANLYAASKQAFADICRFYVAAHGFSVVELKLFDVYGPNDPRGRLLPALVGLAVNGGHLALSPGEQRIDLIHVSDVVASYVAAAERLMPAEPGYEEFAVKSGRDHSIREIAAMVEAITQRAIAVTWGGRPYRAREVMRPWRSSATLPGWTAKVGLEAGLRAMIETFKDGTSVSNTGLGTPGLTSTRDTPPVSAKPRSDGSDS